MCPWVGPHAPSLGGSSWGAAQLCGVSLTTRGIAPACLRYDRLALFFFNVLNNINFFWG